jgi:lactate dehydrogenase-like 2-hydroxyacid dehydrogenase
MTTGVLALLRTPPERAEALRAAGYHVRIVADYPSRADAIRDAGADVQVVLTNGRGGISAAEMAQLPNLKIVCAVSAGYEAVDLAEAKRRGIPVTHSPGTNAKSVADHAMMLLLACVRHLRAADKHVHAGAWQDQWKANTTVIFGKRLGVIGMGNIGGGIAYRASRGFDMEVGYHNRKLVAGSPHRYFDSAVKLAEWADFLVTATPGGAATKHVVNAEVLNALGPKGYLVSVGRGTAVDTEALLAALKDKRIAGAGLDVLEGEPQLPPLLPALLQFDNVIVTPHGGGRAPESTQAGTELLLKNLEAHFSGKPLLTPVWK